MPYSLVPLRWRDATAAARWHYDGQYGIYDFDLWGLRSSVVLQSILRVMVFFSMLDAQGELLGLFTFTHLGDTVEIGVGMRPDLTGKGHGVEYFNAGLEFARQRYRPKRFMLTVAAFNVRAQRVYTQAGFAPVRTFRRRTRAGWIDHIEMQRDA